MLLRVLDNMRSHLQPNCHYPLVKQQLWQRNERTMSTSYIHDSFNQLACLDLVMLRAIFENRALYMTETDKIKVMVYCTYTYTDHSVAYNRIMTIP